MVPPYHTLVSRTKSVGCNPSQRTRLSEQTGRARAYPYTHDSPTTIEISTIAYPIGELSTSRHSEAQHSPAETCCPVSTSSRFREGCVNRILIDTVGCTIIVFIDASRHGLSSLVFTFLVADRPSVHRSQPLITSLHLFPLKLPLESSSTVSIVTGSYRTIYTRARSTGYGPTLTSVHCTRA